MRETVATLLRPLAVITHRNSGSNVRVGLAHNIAGVVRVTETVPVHLRDVSKLFVERLDEQELAV
jgi:hypothetical protein